jgi:hypothetical protein
VSGSSPGQPPRPFRVSDLQAQRKFRHARQFGVQGSYNRQSADRFKAALAAHVVASGTQFIRGMYARGAGSGGFPALFYVDPVSRLIVVADVNGNFVTGYRLSPRQLWNIQRNGRLGGGP